MPFPEDPRAARHGRGATVPPRRRAAQALKRAAPPLAQAQCRVTLGGEVVAYTLRRSARRTIGLSIDENGLTVRAPLRTSLRAVEAALAGKARWIHAKLAHALALQARASAHAITWHAGAVLPFLGEPLTLQLAPARCGRYAAAATLDEAQSPRALRLLLAADASSDAIRSAALRWLQGRARRLFTERLDHYAPQLGVHWRELRLTAARTRWGSASAHGIIRLNWKLLHFALPLIDYVVVHELAHLLEMNHSARFWAQVARVLPDYAARRDALKTAVLPPY